MVRLRAAPDSRGPAAELPYDLVAEIARAAGGKAARAMRLCCRRWRVGVAQGCRSLQVTAPRGPKRTTGGRAQDGSLSAAKGAPCLSAHQGTDQGVAACPN